MQCLPLSTCTLLDDLIARSGAVADKEDLRALTPLIYSHVTPYGLFRLDLTERMRIEEEASA